MNGPALVELSERRIGAPVVAAVPFAWRSRTGEVLLGTTHVMAPVSFARWERGVLALTETRVYVLRKAPFLTAPREVVYSLPRSGLVPRIHHWPWQLLATLELSWPDTTRRRRCSSAAALLAEQGCGMWTGFSRPTSC